MTEIVLGQSLKKSERRPPYLRLATATWDSTSTPGIENASEKPSLLVSFPAVRKFMETRDTNTYRDWAMDSGAFSAFNSGMVIDLQEYIEFCLEIMATDPTLTEIFALDVIGDWKASIVNCEKMWEAGVPAIPCYHTREPEHALTHITKTYPKIALGGLVGIPMGPKEVVGWLEQCFARIWPKRVHVFGTTSKSYVLRFPASSWDSTNWVTGPCAFGSWSQFGNLSVRGSKQNLRSEVEFFLDLENRARVKWRKQMKELDDLNEPLPEFSKKENVNEVSGDT